MKIIKKYLLICLLAGLALSIIIYISIVNNKVGKFSVLDYEYFISEFPTSIVAGNINSADEAKKEAEKIWIDIYGEGIKGQRPYKVSYDSVNQVWMVRGTLFGNQNGGTAAILINKEGGEVLAVWHEK